jgi:Protein of unknown function (DUF2505)
VHLKERVMLERALLPNGHERMRVRVVPHVGLPGPIAKLLEGAEISYDEITVFDAQGRRAALTIESPAGDTVQVRGEVRLLAEPNGVRLLFDGEAHVKVFGLGGLIERFMVAEIKRRYGVVEHALQRFVDEGRHLSSDA